MSGDARRGVAQGRTARYRLRDERVAPLARSVDVDADVSVGAARVWQEQALGSVCMDGLSEDTGGVRGQPSPIGRDMLHRQGGR